MACGTPCVATDVGASALLIGENWRTHSATRKPGTLASAWHDVLLLDFAERVQLGLAARRRIEENFSMDAAAFRYGRFL